MTVLQEQVIEETESEKSQKAYQELQRYRKSRLVDLDYKLELAEALEEKYKGIN